MLTENVTNKTRWQTVDEVNLVIKGLLHVLQILL
jgi:hypothetical protein